MCESLFSIKNSDETVTLGNGITLFVPKGKQVCHGCGGHKTKDISGLAISTCYDKCGNNGFKTSRLNVDCDTCKGDGYL